MVSFLHPRRGRRAEPLWLFARAAARGAGGGATPRHSGSEHGGGVAMCRRLNALFAFAVNNSSMSMVNFTCPVPPAGEPAANGMSRRKTSRPAHAPAAMEAGADARL